jgi:hypothetical protein
MRGVCLVPGVVLPAVLHLVMHSFLPVESHTLGVKRGHFFPVVNDRQQ